MLINYYSYESVDYVKGKTKGKDENGEEGEIEREKVWRCNETNFEIYFDDANQHNDDKKGTRKGKKVQHIFIQDRLKKGTQNDTFILINYTFYCRGLRPVKGQKKILKNSSNCNNFFHGQHK